MTQNNAEPFKINLFALGNFAVGKTCFINQFTHNTFRKNYISTIGVDYSVKNVILPSGKKAKLVFYDTAGQERYRSLSFNLLRNADGILLMYDITNIETFKAIKGWTESIKDKKGNDFPIVLIGNKSDLESERKIPKEEGIKEAKNNGFPFFETSCKENINIEEAINTIVSMITDERGQIKKERNESVQLEKKKLKKHKRICKC